MVSPGGYMGSSYVHYGLGNFVFYNFNGPTAQTGVLRLTLQGGEILEDEWLPGRIEGGVPILFEDEQAIAEGVAGSRATENSAAGSTRPLNRANRLSDPAEEDPDQLSRGTAPACTAVPRPPGRAARKKNTESR